MNIGNRDVAKGLPRVVRGCPGDVQGVVRGWSGVGKRNVHGVARDGGQEGGLEVVRGWCWQSDGKGMS